MYRHGRCGDYRDRYERRPPLAQLLLAALAAGPVTFSAPGPAAGLAAAEPATVGALLHPPPCCLQPCRRDFIRVAHTMQAVAAWPVYLQPRIPCSNAINLGA